MAIILLHHVQIWSTFPIIAEFTLLKRAIFAAICPQFDDDHSSPWHSETDWKIAILISEELLAIISLHHIKIW